MTEHPDALLAGYVDGDLDAEARRAVEEHLAGCDRCREEVALAGRARDALGALEPIPAPAGLAMPAMRQERRRRVLGRAARWGAGVAAAAAIVAIVVVTVPTREAGRQAADDAETAEGGGAVQEADAPAERTGPPGFFTTGAEYDQERLRALARALAEERRLPPAPPGEGITTGEGDEFTEETTLEATERHALDSPAARGAVSCIERAGLRGDQTDELLYIEAARFEGDAAYIAVLRTEDEGIDIWVVGRADCQIAFVASQEA